eukprot:gene23978-31126_t
MNSYLLVTSLYVLNLKQGTLLTSLSCTKRLDELSRTEIQAIAKHNNIRANLKTSEILAELNKLGVKSSVPVSETFSSTEKNSPVDISTTTTTRDDADGIHDQVQEILSSQGIDFSDLLKLQQKLVKSSAPKMGKDAAVTRNRSSKKAQKEPLPPPPPIVTITKTSFLSSSSSSSVVADEEGVLVLPEGDLINGSRRKKKSAPLKEIPSPIMDNINETTKTLSVESQPDRAKPRKVTSKDSVIVPTKKAPPSKEITVDVDLTGVTLSNMMTELVSSIGYDALYEETNLRCFKILRQEDMVWARKKIEYLFIKSVKNGVISTPSPATKAKAKSKPKAETASS